MKPSTCTTLTRCKTTVRAEMNIAVRYDTSWQPILNGWRRCTKSSEIPAVIGTRLNILKEIEGYSEVIDSLIQVALFYEQMEGMSLGWLEAAKSTGHSMGNYGFMWFNIFGDMEEFEQIFKIGNKESKAPRRHMLGSGSCSALIKVLPDLSDIYTSHVVNIVSAFKSWTIWLLFDRWTDLEQLRIYDQGSEKISFRNSSNSQGRFADGSRPFHVVFVVPGSAVLWWRFHHPLVGDCCHGNNYRQQQRRFVEVYQTYGPSLRRNPLGGGQQIGYNR